MPDPESPVVRKLKNWQAQLLDLSRANRLLYFKLDRASSIPITSPAPADLFHQLVTRGKPLVFPLADEQTLFDLDQPDGDVDTATPSDPAAPEDRPVDSLPPGGSTPIGDPSSAAASQVDTSRKRAANVIGTALSDQRLSRALYNLRARSRAAAEEQGVNVLFVAFGLLHWTDPETNDAVQSPVLLVPAALNREALHKPYTLSMLEDDIVANPTLAHKLDTDFAIQLPDAPDDIEESGLAAYVDQVCAAIKNRSGWGLSTEAVLGIFSFQKINLYQDLAAYQDVFCAHPIIAALGGAGPLPPPPSVLAANELDDRVPPTNTYQVIDADSSQQEAIQAAKAGASFVLQGPPGTGKSQTIANIIAEMLAAGKRVLFVSQKMAALEVVQRRLNEAGLGEFCLQLHNHKRDKREVVRELVQALDAPDVQLRQEYEASLLELDAARRNLNAYARALHTPRFALHQSVFRAHGEMARLHDAAAIPRGRPDGQAQGLPLRFDVGDVMSVNANELARRVNLLERLMALPDVIDHHAHHPWRASVVRSVSFALRDQLAHSLDDLSGLVPQFAAGLTSLAAVCGLRAPINLAESKPLLALLKDYDARLFALDLDAMAARFGEKYRSFLRGALPDYRADLRLLTDARVSKEKLTYEQALELIDRARAIRSSLAPNTPPIKTETASAKDVFAISPRIDQSARVLIDVFGSNPIDAQDFAAMPAWLAQRRAAIAQLDDYASFNRLRDEAPALKLDNFIQAALAAQLPASHWRDAYLQAFWQNFVDAATQADDALRSFDSRAHTTLIDRFKELDRQQMILARARIRAILSDQRPKSSWIDAASAEQSILRREAAKKRRLKPLRKLFAEVPRLITDLKPCLLMSPITVSLLLDPNVFKFDLVIFDEASQIAPEEAAGAIVRGVQTIIVGDKQQLPPTRFFTVVGGDEAEEASDEDEGGRVFESILEESEGLSLPQKMLLWHYRSRDEELIAFSNHHFYNDRLYTFPNVQHDGQGLGVEFVLVPEGVYLRGRNLRRNDVEARRVVDLIFEHAAQSSDRTLGVIAFSYAQRDAIRLEWERRRREQPQFEAFFDEDAAEPFFIKNLEMVQGDERDVILFSVGYGKDEAGKMTFNFGPLNQAGGERRLNVAVSRARYHVKLVASFQPEDIDLARTTSQGARLLKDYMLFARDGIQALSAIATYRPDAKSESPFEEAVYQALTPRGLRLHQQVGVSGYRIDLAVVDTDQPGRYLLGIECDGATYHSAQTARDRDRLRQQVLEGLGWTLHRIWSRDWITDRSREIDKVMNAVQTAKQKTASTAAVNPPETSADKFLTDAPPVEMPQSLPAYVWPYKRAKLDQHANGEELGKADPASVANDVVRVVKSEGPVHVEAVADRIGQAWGVTRIGKRIQSVLTQAIALATQAQQIVQRDAWLWPIGLEKPIVRAPDQGDEPRPIEWIAPDEIVEAAYLCVEEARSLSDEDLIRETAQLLGYARSSAKIEAIMREAIGRLTASGRIEVEGTVVRAKE
jgi:very-short-patch-repair endonuclease